MLYVSCRSNCSGCDADWSDILISQRLLADDMYPEAFFSAILFLKEYNLKHKNG